MAGRSEVEDERSKLVRLAARLIIEEALEGETRDALGRDYCARGARPGAGYRNGCRRGGGKRGGRHRVQRAAKSPIERTVSFAYPGGRTEELEALAVATYARGLSTRDIEGVFADANSRNLLSRTAVSEITERLWAEYEAFASRDPSEFAVTYLLVDGIAERLHLGQLRGSAGGLGHSIGRQRRCYTWRRGPRRIPRAAGSSSMICAGAVCPTRCWWPATGRPA
jgi:putative transposase